MPSTTLLLNGFSFLNDVRANTNASGGGELMIHDGDAPFESDDIIMLLVDNVTADGILTNASVVTGMIVFDNASDYYNNIALYTYAYSGPDSGVDIPNGRNGMGDTYLRFDANRLVSSDPGAPDLGRVAMVAGVDLASQVAAGVNPIRIDTFQDVDIDNDGQITGQEAADGAFSDALNGWIPICFTRGTLIETPDGPRFIEMLAEGDMVSTLDHGPQPIRWIGSRRVRARGPTAPVTIRAGALGNIRALRVSQNHRMLIRGPRAELLFGEPEVLIAAKHLVDGAAVRIEEGGLVDYIHFLFDRHEIVFAEGCPSESLFPGRQTLKAVDAEARDEIVALFPELRSRDCIGKTARPAMRAHEAQALRMSA